MDHKLETLIAFGETKNYTKAAQLLGISQPAVSQHIRALEESFGCRLVHRTEMGMQLTPQGELAVRYAKQIVSLYRSLVRRMEDFRRAELDISVGLTHSAESHIMAQVLASCCAERSDISFTIHTDSFHRLLEKLRAGELDLAVAEGEISEDTDMASVLLDTDCLMVVLSPDHPLAKNKDVTLDELKQENLILRLPDSGTRNQFQTRLESRGMSLSDFRVSLQVDSISTIKELIMQRFGISVLARSACLREAQSRQLILLPIRGMNMSREIRLVYRKDFRHAQILQDLISTYETIVSRKD